MDPEWVKIRIFANFCEHRSSLKVNTEILLQDNQIYTNYVLSEKPSTLKSELEIHQKQGLTWMLYREGKLSQLYPNQQKERTLHDFYKEIELPEGSKLYFNPFCGDITTKCPEVKSCKGGILADEMGLGKTVMTVALIHSHRRDNEEENQNEQFINSPEKIVVKATSTVTRTKSKNQEQDSSSKERYITKTHKNHNREAFNSFFVSQPSINGKRIATEKDILESDDENEVPNIGKVVVREAPVEETKVSDIKMHEEKETNNLETDLNNSFKGTLIVMSKTLLSQWDTEIKKHSKSESLLSCLIYHDKLGKSYSLKDYDVVLTTYGTVHHQFKTMQNPPLFGGEWFRIILDEAHEIRNKNAQKSKALFSLKAKYRWCFTGTPLQNDLNDFYSLLKFLRVDVWSDESNWKKYINQNKKADEVVQIIKSIAEPIMLRRTKDAGDPNITAFLNLKPPRVEVVFVQLSEDEKAVYNVYDEKFQKAKIEFRNNFSGTSKKGLPYCLYYLAGPIKFF